MANLQVIDHGMPLDKSSSHQVVSLHYLCLLIDADGQFNHFRALEIIFGQKSMDYHCMNIYHQLHHQTKAGDIVALLNR
jgi:hypothetical protein